MFNYFVGILILVVFVIAGILYYRYRLSQQDAIQKFMGAYIFPKRHTKIFDPLVLREYTHDIYLNSTETLMSVFKNSISRTITSKTLLNAIMTMGVIPEVDPHGNLTKDLELNLDLQRAIQLTGGSNKDYSANDSLLKELNIIASKALNSRAISRIERNWLLAKIIQEYNLERKSEGYARNPVLANSVIRRVGLSMDTKKCGELQMAALKICRDPAVVRLLAESPSFDRGLQISETIEGKLFDYQLAVLFRNWL